LSERYKPDLQKEIPNVDQYFGTTELPRKIMPISRLPKVVIVPVLFVPSQ